MINLEILLKDKKYSEAKTEIIRLLQVSTGEPILELIILVHLQNIHVLPFLNSVYRAVKFCNGKDVKIAVLLMIDILQDNITLNENLSEIQLIDYITHINEIQNTKQELLLEKSLRILPTKTSFLPFTVIGIG